MESEKPEKKKICILIPAYGNIPATFLPNFISFVVKNSKKYIIDVTVREHNPVSKSRNELVELAMKMDPDYILFLDTDNLVPTTALDNLIKVMEEKDADLVTALYFQKAKPYLPVIREYKLGGFWNIENPELGTVIAIDGCGMGCCLINPRVFKKLEYPWFKFNYETWGRKRIHLSEDLWFCRNMLRAGMKLYCDASLISSHIGAIIDVFEYMSLFKVREDLISDRNDLMGMIEQYTGENELEVTQKTKIGPTLMKEEWEKKSPKTGEEIKKFYKETKNYLYDLGLWHMSNRRQFDIELVDKIIDLKPKNVLEFGCGIGQNAIMIAREKMDVTIADLDSYTLKFAEFRFKEKDISYKVWKTDIEDMPPDKKYDLILCFDVLEHLPDEEFKNVINKLIRLKHKDTTVMLTYSPGKDVGGVPNSHPMHFDKKEENTKLIGKLLKDF